MNIYSKIIFFPVHNGNMTFIKLNDEKKTTLLIDLHVRQGADKENDEDKYDVASHLREYLEYDSKGRQYIDVFLLSHNDIDHIKGVQNHFYLGNIDDYPEKEKSKIVLNEIWCSSRFWNRDSSSNSLCDDGKAFNKEMKRRVNLFKENKIIQKSGNRAIIICADDETKVEGLETIVRNLDLTFSKVNEIDLSGKLKINILGPLPLQDDEDINKYKRCNRGSVILSITINEGAYKNQILIPGDAECFVWETLYSKFKNNFSALEYDILLIPHHCSWYSIGYKDRFDNDKRKLVRNAFLALSQAKVNSILIASSKAIKESDSNPPHYEAKIEYKKIKNVKEFYCTQEYPNENDVNPIVFDLTEQGPRLNENVKENLSDNYTSYIYTSKSKFDVSWRVKPVSIFRMNIQYDFDIGAIYYPNSKKYLESTISNHPKQIPFKSNNELLNKEFWLQFHVDINVVRYKNDEIWWQVINTGDEAIAANQKRGEIFLSKWNFGNKYIHYEHTLYKGSHCVICYIINNNICYAQSKEFIVNIR
jgi:hypothetical protein